MQLLVDVIMLGGTARTRDLLQLGHSKYALALAVRDGDLIRIRQGHYGVGRQDELGLSAYRVGGHLAGMSALIAHGVWVPRRSHPLEIAVPPHSRALRLPSDARRRLEPGAAIVHWDDERIVRSAPFAESAARALQRVAVRLSAGELFAAFESALAKRLLSRSEAESLRALFARTVDGRFAQAGRLSGSGAESLLHFWLLGIGVGLVQQLSIAGVGDVDFVLGDGRSPKSTARATTPTERSSSATAAVTPWPALWGTGPCGSQRAWSRKSSSSSRRRSSPR